MPTAIRVTGLSKAYGTNAVLDSVDLIVEGGTIRALLGPNGAGKTTMVRILSTLLRPDSGSAVVAGHDVLADPAGVRSAISLTGQYAAVDEPLTGAENLRMMARLFHLGRAERRGRVAELIEMFDLTGAAGRPVKTYSGGMRRRLDLAVGLLARPRVLFLDEPTTGLDPRSRRSMWEAIRGLLDDGVTILLTTQYLEEADHLADRISVLDHGSIIAEGTAAELKRHSARERLELELGDPHAYDRAAAELGAWRGAEGGVALDPVGLTVGVATDGSADDVRRVLVFLEARGVRVRHVHLTRPSLDDVFLSLTGGPERPAAAEPEEVPA
ncbi:MAG TPA: ATP-binding cassette domain-containing protein [Streptosporangiaceae bacterium]|jgi:ABC-2 type transport system ATP-binding protein